MEYRLRKAKKEELPELWVIFKDAIERRKNEGSEQWQDGYPNLKVLENDLQKGQGYVFTDGKIIVGYCSVAKNDEPAYKDIKGSWLSNEDFLVYHRVAIATPYLGKGFAQKMIMAIEKLARDQNVFNLRADTNFDNSGMLRIFEKLGYQYRGKVTFRGGTERMAFEKALMV